MILLIAFAAMLLLCFAVMVFFTRSSFSNRVAKRRLTGIIVTKNGTSSSHRMEQFLKISPEHKTGWLDGVLQKYRVVHKLEAWIAQANNTMTVSTLLLSSAGLGITGFAATYWWLSILPISIVTAFALGYIPFGVISFKRSRRLTAFNAALPDAIDMMGRAMRAGHSLAASINTVSEQSAEPVRSEFREAFKQQNFGLPLRDALTQMLDRSPSQDLKVLITGIIVQKETGGNLAEILDRTASVIRERLRIQREIRTYTAQGRMTGWILCSLPVVMLVMINIINPGYSNVLLNTGIGHLLICIGLGLLITGAMIIRYIINGIEV
jgi:tight adherence protein B